MENPVLRILQVEDTPMNLKVLDDMLSSLGHAPQSVTSVAEALEALRVQRFDLVITDLHMPQVDGTGLLRALQATGRSFPPVVLVTADVMTHSPREYLRMGFSDYLSKPVRLVDLQRVLASVIDLRGNPQCPLFG